VTTLHLTNSYHPESGGIKTFYHALLEAADREGRRVVLVVPGGRTESADVGRLGRIYRIRAPRAPAFDRRYRMLLPHRYLPGPVPSELVTILERERPQLIEVCDKYSLPYFAALLRRGWYGRLTRPTLVGLTCERFDDNMAAYLASGRAARAFTRWYIRHIYAPPFDVHFAVSEYVAEELRTALPDRPREFVRVCSMGVDVDVFHPQRASAAIRADLASRAGGTSDSVLLLYAGRLSPEKNIGLLVEMMQHLAAGDGRDYRLVVAGDGPRAEWLRDRASGALAARIALCGTQQRETLASWCASVDVFVHPNPREPFGIGPLEAMASGVPVVLPNTGGVLSYATERNAWLAAPRGAAFADAVRAAARRDDARVLEAGATAQRYRWNEVTSRHLALCDAVQGRFWGARDGRVRQLAVDAASR
jgi:alpha-1,6-mannosyltransferase